MFNKMKKCLNGKKGFTLVELIVVIVIILILAAVLVPNVSKYIGQARQSNVQSEASNYLTELQADYTYYIATVKSGDSAFTATYSGVSAVSAISDKASFDNALGDKNILYIVDGNTVTDFEYANSGYFVKWSNTDGWGTVTKKTN